MQGRIAMAEGVIGYLELYLAIGLALAALFALVGVSRLDPGARFDRTAPAGSLLFRLLLVPAATLLWPVVLVRSIALLRASRARTSATPTAPDEPPRGAP